MGQAMTKLKLDYINEYVDRTGKLRGVFSDGVPCAVPCPVPSVQSSLWRHIRIISASRGRRPTTKGGRLTWPADNRILCLAPLCRPKCLSWKFSTG